jgi:hypothetical protein
MDKMEKVMAMLDNLILQSGYGRNERKEVGSEYEEFVSHLEQLLSEEFEKGVIKGRLEALPITRQLISERAFTKKELEYLGEFVDFRKEHYKGNGGVSDWYYEKMLEISRKISKLLKKEE